MFGHQDEDQNQQNNGVTGTAEGPTQTAVDQPAVDNDATQTDTSQDSQQDDNSHSSYLDNLAPEPLAVDEPADNRGGPATDDLLDIKRQALEELSPLVGHLDQSAEEKFKTTMMMIQGNDNQSLIPEAYKAAKEITDDKARAQALLDIVNEINYFTHQHDN